MSIDLGYVRRLFAHLEDGHANLFFDHVADDVHWTVMGTHPLAGVYTSKADFLAHTFDRLARLLKEGSVVMQVTHAMVDGDRAARVVE